MSKRKKEKIRENRQKMDSAWMVLGMFIGWLVGAVLGWICGQPFLWMPGGAISGFLIGAIVDIVLHSIKRRAAKLDLLKRQAWSDHQK